MAVEFIAFYSGAYLKKTQHLSTEQHGAYLLLLMHCWQFGKIPLDDASRSRIARMSHNRWKKIGGEVAAYFDENGFNKRASEEVQRAEDKRIKRSISGFKGGTNSAVSRAAEASKWQANDQAKSKQTTKQTTKQTVKQTASDAQAIKNSKITNTSFLAAREEEVVDNLPAPALATALCDGALAPGPVTEPAAPKQPAVKKPCDMTKAELDQLYAQRREQAKTNPQPTTASEAA